MTKRSHHQVVGSCLLFSWLVACSGASPEQNAGSFDASLAPSSSEAGPSRGGRPDAGLPDASVSPDPVPAEIPGAWPQRPTACFGIGNACDDNCGGACFLGEPEFCAPRGGGGLICSPGSCPVDKPFCLLGLCMELEDAACVCTGSVTQELSICKASPRASTVSECLDTGASCMDDHRPCCDGLGCYLVDGAPVCGKPCADSAECESGCCNRGLCAAADACGGEGESCESRGCRVGTACAIGDEATECRRECDTKADCSDLRDAPCCEPFGATAICWPGASC